jgi:dihydrofolate synthase/folylpolyglutamate synthase
MTEIRTMADAEKVLATYVPLSAKITGKDITLGRMQKLMQAIGNPHKGLKIIHVAGTSGKTSTTYYISALLVAAGKKVGTTVSPHIDSVAERVQINLQPLAEQTFCQELSEFMELISHAELEPTYFELIIAFAYWYFVKAGVDYAVIETGMGGLQDATNVANNPDKVCVITDIGYDHMSVLGYTLPEIAAQKAGIIQQDNWVFSYGQGDEINNVLELRSKQQQAHLVMLDRTIEPSRYEIPEAVFELPYYQQYNWILAFNVFEYMCDRDALSSPSEAAINNTIHIQVPGRMDIVQIAGKTLVMDGAHNSQKMYAFVKSFKKKYPGQKVAILLSLKEGKEYADVLPLLAGITDNLILTSFMQMQDLPSHAIDPHKLAAPAKAAGFKVVVVEPDLEKAYELLLKQPEKLLIITGSFYLIAQLRQTHKELHHV